MKKLASLCILIVHVEGHMKMNFPIPYGRSTLDNSPLLLSGADFPCKQRPGVYAVEDASNVYALGSTNPLNFTGTAVHGGGSCQISMTYDVEPNQNSVWKVLTSIEGGCPARDQTGNMGSNANAADPFQYEFTIPHNIPAGKGTIAWTWFNKVGQREMYMNCGPLTLTGGGGSQANFDNLPDMFRANIGNDCHVPDNKDVVFPDPGKDLIRLNGATNAFHAPTGPGCDSVAAPNPTLRPTATNPTNGPSTTLMTVTSNMLGGEPKESSVTGPTCKNEGSWNCIDGSSFQRCVGGRWSAPQQLAAGRSCKPGVSVNFEG